MLGIKIILMVFGLALKTIVIWGNDGIFQVEMAELSSNSTTFEICSCLIQVEYFW